LSVKAVCDALLELFVNIGVPKVIISDCGTNFTSQLTREILCKLRCTPRFNTPKQPEASGMVERFNQLVRQVALLWQRDRATRFSVEILQLNSLNS